MGRVAGPWGGIYGSNFTIDGVVVGFHGAIKDGTVSSIGVYTLESARVGGVTVGSSLSSNVTLWDDGPQHPEITQIQLWEAVGESGGNFVAGIKVVYSGGAGDTSFEHGQTGGDSSRVLTFTDSLGEVLVQVSGFSSDNRIDYLLFETSRARYIFAGTPLPTSKLFRYEMPIFGFYGATKDGVLVSLGFYTLADLKSALAKTAMFGLGDPRIPWDDSPSVVTGISSIDFYADSIIFGPGITIIRGIQTNYSSGLIAGHGRLIGNRTSVRFDSGESISSVSGGYGAAIYHLTITTTLGRTYGPIGTTGTCDCNPFGFTGPVFGFFGWR
eukprot:jgi/Botrbrau1/14404/Bobra.0014s0051.1